MPRQRVPIVGARAAGLVGLSPRVRHILARQARRQARRLVQPEIRAARQAYRPIRRAYRQNVRSASSAVALSEGLLADQAKALKASGLKGSALRQTQREFSARSGDLATSLPFLTSQARAQRQTDVAAADQNLLQAQADKKHQAGQILNSLLSTARTQGRSALKSRTGDKGTSSKEYKIALVTARRQFDAAPLKVWKNLNGKLWEAFVHSVQGEGVNDPRVAERAARSVAYHRLNKIYGDNVSPEFFEKWLASRIKHGG